MRPKNAQQAHRRTPVPDPDLIEATLRICILARAHPPKIHCTPPEHHPPEQHPWMAAAEKKKLKMGV